MKKLFISQPTKNKSHNEIVVERARLAKKISVDTHTEYEIIESYLINTPYGVSLLWVIGKSIQLLGDADLAYFCSGWEYDERCRIEHECAINYGIPCAYA